MQLQTGRRRILLAGAAALAGTTLAIFYRSTDDMDVERTGTVEVVQGRSPEPVQLQPIMPMEPPPATSAAIDIEAEAQLLRHAKADFVNSQLRAREREQTAFYQPPATNTVEPPSELAWQP